MDPFNVITVLTDEATREDEFERDIYVSSLRQVIESAASPLVVALYGAWGSGKTMMMMRLREQLEGGSTSRNGWLRPCRSTRGNTQAMVSRRLVSCMPSGKPSTLKVILQYAGRYRPSRRRWPQMQVAYLGISVGKITDAYRKLADEDIEKRTQQAALRARFVEVIGVARAAAGSLPIVIFIDDLDCCQPGTAVAILDAMKLFFNLSGCVFVLGADQSHLEAAVQAEYKGLEIAHINSYLDKIVQFPFAIPTLPAKSVRDYIYSHTSSGLWNCAPMLASAAPDNPRQLKRLINSLTFLDHIARASVFPDYDNHVMRHLR